MRVSRRSAEWVLRLASLLLLVTALFRYSGPQSVANALLAIAVATGLVGAVLLGIAHSREKSEEPE